MSVKANKSLDDGLVLYVPMNEGSGSTVYDRSKNGNNGAITGASWVVDEDLGNCLEFSNDKIVSVPYNADLDLLDNFTFSATIKRYEAKVVEVIFGAYNHALLRGWDIEVNNGLLNLVIGTGAASVDNRDTTLLGLNEAIDVAVTYESGTIKFYVNGVLSSTITGAASPVSSSTDFKFGQRTIGDWDFYGIIKNARLYNRVLTETEISALYRLGLNKSLSDGLVLDMPLNEGSGSTVFDKSKYSNNGAITGATWVVDEEKGRCLSFDGVDDKVEIPANSAFDVAEFTVYAEVYVESVSKVFEIFSRTDWNYQRFQWRDYNSKLCLIHTFAGTTADFSSDVIDVADILNKWLSVAVTVSTSTITFYLNGVFNTSFSIVNPADVSSGKATIGNCGGIFSEGKIRNTRFYNRALSDAEISALYRLTKKGVE